MKSYAKSWCWVWYYFLISVFLVVIFAGCGKSEKTLDMGGASALNLEIKLPRSLETKKERLKNFIERTTHIEVNVSTKEGESYLCNTNFVQGIPLKIPDIVFPKGSSDRLEIKLKMWDRQKNGILRTYPALISKTLVSAEEFIQNTSAVIVTKFKLQVEPSDYD